MKILLALAMYLASIGTGCAIDNGFENRNFMSGPDLNKWLTYSFELAQARLTFEIPGNTAKRWSRPSNINLANLDDESKYDSIGSIEFFNEKWTYDLKGAGYAGSLVFSAQIFHTSFGNIFKNKRVNVRCFQGLGEFFDAYYKDLAEKNNAKLLAQGLVDRIIIPPAEYKLVPVGFGGQVFALHYNKSGQINSSVYVLPLDEKRFLQLKFQYIENLDPENNTAWIDRSVEAERLIASKLRFDEHWPGFSKECENLN